MRLAATSRSADRTARRLDVGFYAVCVTFAGLTAFWSEFFGYRVWGAITLAAYVFGLGQALVALRRPFTTPTNRW
ncbi:MAG TPA: hypothetical protein VH333_15725, partial [Pseudonocardiaceae bacterium]|nr:hypothetical protein [Pseudonocardiaceae bacterium]